MNEPLIRACGLQHTYMAGTPLAVPALVGVNLEIAQGEAVGIVGPSGAGKSTLVQHLNGLLRPSARGQLWIDGADMADPAVDVRRLRRRVGLVFQRPEDQLFQPLVGDDIAFGPRQMGLPRGEVRERVRAAMEQVGLDFDAFKDRPILSLSGGERRRAAIAGVLALRPEVLIMDEATSGLDPRGRRGLLDLARRLHHEEGKTVVLVASHMEDLVGVVERVVVLAAGRSVLQGGLREVLGASGPWRAWGLELPAMPALAGSLAGLGMPLDPLPLTVDEAEVAVAARWEA